MSSPTEFSFRTRAENLRTLAGQTFDVVVIGGGITGAGVAREAALNGLSVALVERRDFASGTSSRSSKLIHGGLRYLPQGYVGLVREAATERQVVRDLAPHLARPEQMLVPVANRRAYAKIKVGLWTYDRLAGVAESERYRMVSKAEALALEPSLRPERMYGAGLYYEYLTDDARLVVEVAKAAMALGAVAANYAEVDGVVLENGRLVAIMVHDVAADERFEVRGRVVVNAAGPWVDAVRLLGEPTDRPRLHLTKGIHVGVRSERLGLSRTVVMSARDKRLVFAIPHGAVTYIGTTDTDYPHPEDYPEITAGDVNYLIEAANRTLAADPPLATGDVVSAWAGLRPLLHREGKKPSELSRKDEVMIGETGLVSVAGGKLTTFRRMAERVVDIVCERLEWPGGEMPARKGTSEGTPLGSGATGYDLDAYAARLLARLPALGRDVVVRLVNLYGSHAEAMVDAMIAEPACAERLAPSLPVTRAEVEFAVRQEMVLTLEDFMERRSRVLLWQPDNGLAAVEGVARMLAEMLGWNASRVRDEVDRYKLLVTRLKTFGDDAAASS